MAGKSNKGRNRKASHQSSNSSEQLVFNDASVKDNISSLESAKVDANGVSAGEESTGLKADVKESEVANSPNQLKPGEISCMNTFICKLIPS